MSEDLQGVKRVTANFTWVNRFDRNTMADFNKWRDDMISRGAKVSFDRRNNIYCVAPTLDYEMYYNYVTYLNQCHNEWINYGLFDCGMVPYMMWPSFMDNSPVMEQMRTVARRIGITLIPVPAVTFLKQSYVANGQDYWIFREDLYALMKTMEQAGPEYTFDVSSPEEATLSKFLKPLADISRRSRGEVV